MTDSEAAAPRLSVVVLSWNTVDLLRACLASLRGVAGEVTFEVIVVDNDSADGSADMVAADFAEFRLIRNGQNDGYAIGNNIGAREAIGDYVMTLNSDTEVPPGVLTTLVDFLDDNAGHGICAPRLDHPDGTPQLSCKAFPTLRTAVFFDTIFERKFPNNKEIPRYFMADFDHTTSRDVDQPPGAALVIRRSLWEELGGFDPALWLFFNDVDLCRRAHARGWKVAYIAEARILHHEGKSTSKFPEMGAIWHHNRLAYYRKAFGWRGKWVAKVMTAIRGWEEARKMERENQPPEAVARIKEVVREVWRA